MSLLRRALTVLAALFLMFTVPCVTAYAQDVNVGTGSGSIEITNATVDETYTLYKIFDATISADGKNIVYKTTKTDLNAGGFDGSEWFTVNASGEVTKKPALDEDVLKSQEFKTWAKAYGTVTGTPTKATETNLKFTNVPYGYYFVESSLGAVLSVTTTNPTATIIDKNQIPSWDNGPDNPGKVIVKDDGSKVQVNGVSLNTWFPVDIGINAENYEGAEKIFRYYVEDNWDAGMCLDPDTFAVKVTDANGTHVLTDADYTIRWYSDPTMTASSVQTSYNQETTRAFKIEVKWTKDDAVTGDHLYTSGAELHVSYKMKLNPNNADKVNYTTANNNKAKFNYIKGTETTIDGNPPDHNIPEKKTETFTTSIDLLKFVMKGNDKTPLEGAGFTLTGPTGSVIRTTGTEFVKANDGTYWLLKDGTYTTTDPNEPGVNTDLYQSTTDTYKKQNFTTVQGAVSNPATAIFAYSDVNGKVLFQGLGEGTYTLSETVVPAGYNKISDIQFTLKFNEKTKGWDVSNVTGGSVTYDAQSNSLKIEVENKSGTVLPSTGGIGTTLFYTIGGMLVIGAGVLLVVRKRMSAAN